MDVDQVAGTADDNKNEEVSMDVMDDNIDLN